jgi:K(+)-stimulated pyrophosphate-energized sodium pump
MNSKLKNFGYWSILAFVGSLFAAAPSFASEADLVVPALSAHPSDFNLLVVGMVISALGLVYGIIEYLKVKNIKAHKSMLDVGNLIFETCKTYLIQQGKFLIVLELFIAACIGFYFGFLEHMDAQGVLMILGWSVVGFLGSYGVAWYGIRMNTLANARTAFTALEAKPLKILGIPLKVGMSIGVLLVSVELLMMLTILLFVRAIWQVRASSDLLSVNHMVQVHFV